MARKTGTDRDPNILVAMVGRRIDCAVRKSGRALRHGRGRAMFWCRPGLTLGQIADIWTRENPARVITFADGYGPDHVAVTPERREKRLREAERRRLREAERPARQSLDPLRREVGANLIKWAAGRAIFCPVPGCGRCLDWRRTKIVRNIPVCSSHEGAPDVEEGIILDGSTF